MDQSIEYPTWDDVGVSRLIVDYVRNLNSHNVLSYLLVNRVYRVNIKPQYTYKCNRCEYTKVITKVFEEYSRCEQCKSSHLQCTPSYIMGRDRCPAIEESIVPNVLQKMSENYTYYFKTHPPANYINFGWMLDMQIQIPENKAMGADADNPKQLRRAPSVFAQFISGEPIEDMSQTVAICKAAILCPFLWDDCFNWKYYQLRNRMYETPITPLIHMMAKLQQAPMKRTMSLRDLHAWDNNIPEIPDPEFPQ